MTRVSATVAVSVVLTAALWAASTRYLPIAVAGGSMEPALTSGDLLVVERDRTPWVGDLVLFRSGDSLVVHRVRTRWPDGSLTTKGDANNAADREPVEPAAVMGVAVTVLPVGQLVR